ncbi:MAG: STAS/SEC14 domain-containing protein [Vicingaceae bacterium]|nr:STAS/SEC14 domain-containing protein [Vicingaceae bacterium]
MIDKVTYVKLKHAEISLLHKNIYLLVFEDDYEIEIQDAVEIDKAFIELLKGKEFSVLIDTQKRFSSITNEARNFFAKDPEILPFRKKIAIVVDNMPTKLLANFFIRFNKPQTPTRLFTNYDKAMSWLEEED